jgi:hypothetical protein
MGRIAEYGWIGNRAMEKTREACSCHISILSLLLALFLSVAIVLHPYLR